MTRELPSFPAPRSRTLFAAWLVRRWIFPGHAYESSNHLSVAVFGNKQDVLEEPMAAFLTSKLGGIPVKVSLSREECFLATRTRHAFTIDGQMGVNRDGTLKGYSLDVLSNTGAYASHGHSIASAGGNKVAYLYSSLCLRLQFKDLLYQPPLGWCDAWLWRATSRICR
ncbi:xanthine dehydrogenase subunit XdhA [Escherichia coli]|uniref:Xanthine dehydrogenase subunit XdhA n=1 Tax=Escherichia coli TaxID=562 RepID=A0A377BYD1_ECOLX|nr:xanthine dehydrogenase subunit XdhA [Escherichia coli]